MERERERDRETERETERDRETERQREQVRQTHTNTPEPIYMAKKLVTRHGLRLSQIKHRNQHLRELI